MTIVATGHRSLDFEREYLEGAVRQAGWDLSWVHEVIKRLHAAERAKGPDAWMQITPSQFCHEIQEEGLDLGGWPVLFAELLHHLEIDGERRMLVILELQAISALGAQVEPHLNRIKELLDLG